MDSQQVQNLLQTNARLQTELADKAIELQQKNRELEIEAALEKVRARAMVMRNSSELSENSAVMFQQLKELGINAIRTSVGIFDDENEAMELWLTVLSDSQQSIKIVDYVNLHIHPVFENIIPARQQKKPFVMTRLAGVEVKQYYQTMSSYLAELQHKYNDKEFFYSFFFPQGALNVIAFDPLSAEECNIMIRLAQVFGLIYTRFRDLQNAEDQAREAQIEVALEKIRSRSMAMNKTDELKEVVTVVFEKLRELNIKFDGGTSIVTFAEGSKDCMLWVADPGLLSASTLHLPYPNDTIANQQIIADFWHARESGLDFFSNDYSLEDKNTYFKYLFEYVDNKALPDNVKNEILATQSFAHSVAFAKNSALTVSSFSGKLFLDNDADILKRFAKVFEQAYIRFLDLQKAEAQAKEAKIEASLERLRSQAMIMRKSEELIEVCKILLTELQTLGIENIRNTQIAIANDAKGSYMNYDYYSNGVMYVGEILYNSHPFIESLAKKMRQNKEAFINVIVTGAQLDDWRNHLKSLIKRSAPKLDAATSLNYYYYSIGAGGLGFCAYTPLNNEAMNVLTRFKNVFDLAYRRYSDVLQAEAQAREAKIELALERVRARAMAMHNSNELAELVDTVFKELTKLHITLDRCIITIIDEKSRSAMYWMANPELDKTPTAYRVRLDEFPYFMATFTAWKERKPKWVYDLNEAEKRATVEYIFSKTELSLLPEAAKKGMMDTDRIFLNSSFSNFGSLQADTLEPLSDENLDILYRFTKVFDLTYTRFNDLQKAEMQAREAEIELALERVRSRTMAMQKSDEHTDAAMVMFQQLRELGVNAFACGFVILDKNKSEGEFWMSSEGVFQPPHYIPHMEEPSIRNMYMHWKNGEEFYAEEVGGEALKSHYKYLMALPKSGPNFQGLLDAGIAFPEWQRMHAAYFSHGYLLIITKEQYKEENIFIRFAKVFEQTYTRFLDLQKAEVQAREARIENALEKVRSRTMAMQKSNELAETAAVVFKQLIGLGIAPNRLYISIINDNSGELEFWITDEDGNKVSNRYMVSASKNSSLKKMYEGWAAKKKAITVDMQGKELEDWFAYWKTEFHVPFKEGPEQKRRVQNIAYFSKGFIAIASPDEQPEETTRLLERFAAVFNLTYTRFNDLQLAESQTREAKIETALERVRAGALAMQQPEELKEVAQVLRYEMGLLGVEELETCSIYINDVFTEKAECWYAIKDVRAGEKKLVSDHFALNLNDTWVGRQMLQFYNTTAKQTSIIMQGVNRKEWINYCEEKSVPFRGYYGEVIPDRTYHLYKFSHGAIGAAAAADISDESWRLLKRAASVFSLAYSRFKDLTQARYDLQQLKAEKKKAEDAFTELQVTQKQLIQSEKMASLGELTAGIAHEIQNPLNFVNNFSEVNKELLAELKEEIDKGNYDDVKAIAKDIIDNEEKINHHGKRADAIVKGMLQHSSRGSGQKEPTDINALTEEYIRLCYHGLRAKDKSFNATIKTDFDATLQKINIVPQDMGRVILNILTNAFYAVALLPRPAGEEILYPATNDSPTVWVSTKKEGNKVLISVRDNGPGIAQKVIDKIFQPFFTTKPTGQGTGLGLSLSYDIVKAHGGEIKVETKEDEGSEFIIQLPVL